MDAPRWAAPPAPQAYPAVSHQQQVQQQQQQQQQQHLSLEQLPFSRPASGYATPSSRSSSWAGGAQPQQPPGWAPGAPASSASAGANPFLPAALPASAVPQPVGLPAAPRYSHSRASSAGSYNPFSQDYDAPPSPQQAAHGSANPFATHRPQPGAPDLVATLGGGGGGLAAPQPQTQLQQAYSAPQLPLQPPRPQQPYPFVVVEGDRAAPRDADGSGSYSHGGYPLIAAIDGAAGKAAGAGAAPYAPPAFPQVAHSKDVGGLDQLRRPLPPAPLAPPPPPPPPAASSGGGFFARLFGARVAPRVPLPPPPPRPRPAPLGAAAAAETARVVWAPRRRPNPFCTTFSPIALLLVLAFVTAAGYYFYIRAAHTLAMGSHTWYGVLIFITELIGISSVLPYALLLPLYTAPAGSRGLPLDDGRVVLPPEKRFRVHILVPCYKESLSVITNTVTAALAAEVPPGVSRTLYLCDDGKDAAKAAFIATLGDEARYVSGRPRAPGEINGKSANVNNCLKTFIFPDYDGRPSDIPARDLVVVFDADMAAKRHFLLKVLEAMWDDECSLVLTPQAFSNINPKADIFNNINQQFWEYVLPGCDAWGYIACTGTNFCLRARSLAMVGWFPEYTITEDYALSMELKSAGFKGRYLAEYLAVGEAPDEIRNVCRQRSRWTKGHMQIFFSRRCPLLNWRLPLVHKLLYTNGTWAYFCTIITTLVFLFVPFNSLVFGLHPVVFSYQFALAATVYLPLNWALMNYVHRPQDLKGQWMAQVSNHILCFTYMKAVVNTLLSIVGFKAKAGFKATDKTAASPLAAIKTLGSNLVNTMQRGGGAGLPLAAAPPPLSAAAAAAARPPPPPQRLKVLITPDGRRVVQRPLTQAQQLQAQLKAAQRGAKPARRGCWLWINAKTLEGALDPLFLAFSLAVSLASLAAGLYTIVRSHAFEFSVASWSDFTQIFTAGRLDVYLLVPMLWALYNAIPPLLFFIYFFTKGRLLTGTASFMQVFGALLGAAAVASLWLALLVPYKGAATPPPISDISHSLNSAIANSLPRMPGAAPAPGQG